MCTEWNQLRRHRLTAREICQVKEKTEEGLANRILQGTRQTAAMKRGLKLEADAICEYCQIKRVNHFPCGLVIHPDAPWLGASPDGIIFDPSEPCPFGLIEMKCPNGVRQIRAKKTPCLLLANTGADANYGNGLV